MKIFINNLNMPIRSRAFAWGIAVCLAITAVSEAAEVVVVTSNNAMPYQIAQWALKKYLADQKISVRVVRMEYHQDSVKNLMKENPKVFVGVGTEAAVWLRDVIKDPKKIKYCMVSDPQNAGLIQDPPIDGLCVDAPLKMQFELIGEALPKTRTVGMLYSSKTAFGQKLLKDVKAQLPETWKLEAVAVEDYKTLSEAINELFSRPIDIVWTYPEAALFNKASVRELLLSSIRTRVPVFGYSKAFVKAGALLGITINPELQGKCTGELICEWLNTGTCSFSDDAVSRTFEIALNDFAAKQFDISFPESVRKRAPYIFNSK